MIHKGFITSPELSGLQAIKAHYLLVHGHLRGFDEFCEDVIGFSGLGDFIHLPVKTYSQGMAARLLFAVLTGGSHDCLAMDEGFGAGDTSFYDKAQDRMDRFLSSAGTLLLASHSDELLRRFCRRGLVFDSGRLVFAGPLENALDYYHRNHASGSIGNLVCKSASVPGLPHALLFAVRSMKHGKCDGHGGLLPPLGPGRALRARSSEVFG